MRRLSAILLICLPSFAFCETVNSSPRPMARPSLADPATAAQQTLRPLPRPIVLAVLVAPAAPQTLRPMPRPVVLVAQPVAPVQKTVPQPKQRPQGLGQPKPTQKASLKGSVCGNPSIKGQEIAPVRSQVKGCGIKEAVRVTEVDGISLRPAATINCGTAKALDKWIKTSVQPAFGAGQVTQLQIAASYSCRGRNNVKGARISEHGRGNAIDIAGFILADGTNLTVTNNYNKTLRKVHKQACGIFGTTLGPGSDGFHENHIHLDVARYRSGAYCR